MTPDEVARLVATRPRARLHRGADVPRRQARGRLPRLPRVARGARLRDRRPSTWPCSLRGGARPRACCRTPTPGMLSQRRDGDGCRPLNVSLGLMLENVSPRLRDRGMPHHWAPDKEPARRLAHARARPASCASRSRPGILLGIGENAAERVDDACSRIRDLHARLRAHPGGHRAELPREADARAMADAPEPSDAEMARTVARRAPRARRRR